MKQKQDSIIQDYSKQESISKQDQFEQLLYDEDKDRCYQISIGLVEQMEYIDSSGESDDYIQNNSNPIRVL